MEMKDLKSYMGKYAEIALYDDGAGTAEIIDVNEEKIKLMWVQYTSCYDCQVYGAEIYFRPTTYGSGFNTRAVTTAKSMELKSISGQQPME